MLTGMIALLSVLFWNHIYFTVEYCVCFVHFALSYLATRFLLSKNGKHALQVFYAVLFPIFAIGILMGSVFDPESYAITMMVLVCTLTIFITDKPQKAIGYNVCLCALFAAYAHRPDQWGNDPGAYERRTTGITEYSYFAPRTDGSKGQRWVRHLPFVPLQLSPRIQSQR